MIQAFEPTAFPHTVFQVGSITTRVSPAVASLATAGQPITVNARRHILTGSATVSVVGKPTKVNNVFKMPVTAGRLRYIGIDASQITQWPSSASDSNTRIGLSISLGN